MSDLPRRIWATRGKDGIPKTIIAYQPFPNGTMYLRADLLPGQLAKALLREDGWSAEFEDYTESTQQEYLGKANAILKRIKGDNND